MKNLFLIYLASIFLAPAYSQEIIPKKEPFRLGIKAAIGTIVARPEISYLNNKIDNNLSMVQLSHATPQTAYGLFVQKRFGWLFVESNVMYSSYGMVFNVEKSVGDDFSRQVMKEKFNYVDLQLMGGLYSHGFRLSVGPVMHILAGHSSELAEMENYNEKMRNISYGFNGAIGYNLSRFNFDLKYEKAFRTVGDHIYYGYKKSPFIETPDAISFSIGYALLK